MGEGRREKMDKRTPIEDDACIAAGEGWQE